jgi:hypothetical protein
MNTRISFLPLKQSASSNSTAKSISLLRIGAQVVDTIVSMVLAVFAAIFFMWINGSQHEFDQLQDKPK